MKGGQHCCKLNRDETFLPKRFLIYVQLAAKVTKKQKVWAVSAAWPALIELLTGSPGCILSKHCATQYGGSIAYKPKIAWSMAWAALHITAGSETKQTACTVE